MRGSSGLAQRLLRLERAASLNLAHANWRTSACASVFERNLPAVVRPTAARAWLMRLGCPGRRNRIARLMRSGADLRSTALQVSPSNHRQPPRRTQSRLTDFTTLVGAPAQSSLGHRCHLHASPAQGWLYLVAVLDVFTRRVVGWAMHPNPRCHTWSLPHCAWRLAIVAPLKTLILHSDRGAQFASAAYRQVLGPTRPSPLP